MSSIVSHSAAQALLVVAQRHSVAVARNALYELRYVRATKRYYLHDESTNVVVLIDSDSASAVYDAIKRHIVRVYKSVCIKQSVYTMRSDIRSIKRAIYMRMYAH
jgi:hypothetical protein